MTRKKVKLAFITNDSARKATYKKRKRGLLKKMDELTTLCDVKACAILYSPYETKPVVWPGTSGARDVISSFRRLPEMEKAKKMVSQEEFLRQRVAKALEQLKRQQKDNREKEVTQVMYQCLTGKSFHNMSVLDLSDLSWVIDQKLSEISNRIETLRKDNYPTSNVNNHNRNNNIDNKSANNNNIIMADNDSVSDLPAFQQVVGPRVGGEGLLEQRGNLDDIQLQMLQPSWSSFMDMMGPPIALLDQQNEQHLHHQGFNGRLNGNASSNISNYINNTNNINSNMMMMMMGQFSDHHGNVINHASWSNNAFFP